MSEIALQHKPDGPKVDTSVVKVCAEFAPVGQMGQKYLAAGIRMSMRMFEHAPVGQHMPDHARDYETLGYVISGKAELHVEGQVLILQPGDSWMVPRGAKHHYKILEALTAIECTSPPAVAKDRDHPPSGTDSATLKHSAHSK